MIGLLVVAITVYSIVRRIKNLNEARQIHDSAAPPPSKEPRQLPQSDYSSGDIPSAPPLGPTATHAIPAPVQARAVPIAQSRRVQHSAPPALAMARISSQQDNIPVAGYARPI